jgi:hypothetical protein
VVKESTDDRRGREGAARRARPGRHALAVGVAASLLLHLVLVWLDPSFRADAGLGGAPTPALPDEAGRLIQLRLVESSQPEPEPVRVAPVSTTPVRVPPAAPADVAGEGTARQRGRPDATAAERLQYRPGPIWTPPSPVYETVEDCLQRERAERLARNIAAADSARVPIPAPTAAVPQRSGISIPVGPKPLPWGQFVRAPLPDTITPDATSVGREPREPRAAVLRRAPGCMDTVPAVTPRLPIRQPGMR